MILRRILTALLVLLLLGAVLFLAGAAPDNPVSVSGGPVYSCASGSSFCVNGNFQVPSGNVYQIGTDTGLSRDSAGVVDCGNGTAGNKSCTFQPNIDNPQTGLQIAGGAPAGHYPRGNGGSPALYVDSAIPLGDLPLPALIGTSYNTSQYTNATTGLTTISTSPSISASWLVSFECTGEYSVTGTAEKIALAITLSQAAQNLDYGAMITYSAAANTGEIGFSGTATTGGTALPAGGVVTSTTSVYPFRIFGRALWNATNAGTISLQAESSNALGTVTINAYNSSCNITRLL
jgi:hypothetical protein